MTWSIIVKRTGRTWSVFGRTSEGREDLLEGGFFAREAAVRARDAWEKECVQVEVEKAERKAGWDSRP